MGKNKIFIIVGHYGSGKTEFAVNFAYKLLKEGEKVAIADLDVVNPFFRSRGKKKQLLKDGIGIASSNFEDDPYMDLPAISAEIQSFFIRKDRSNIVDVGGDPVGARALGQYSKLIRRQPYEMWIVVNANRYKTQNKEEVLEYIRQIEYECGLTISGLVNNTHYLRETNAEDVLNGDVLVRAVSKETGLPVKYVTYINRISDQVKELDLAGERMPIEMQMREIWQ